MAIYETEEEQVEALKRWWKENGRSTITGVIVGVVIIVGWNIWQDYKQSQALQASALYAQLLNAQTEGNLESAEKIAERIQDQFGGTAYSDYAGLFNAKNKVQQGDLAAAKQSLEAVAKKGSDEIAQVARLGLIRILLAKGEYEQGLQMIAEAKYSDGFSGAYDELKGDLYVALERLGEARTAYQAALRSGHKSPLLQFKLDDITEAEIIVKQ
ncbi:tetratricopeptide repeat protein [Methylotuvimicrobium buryatense]|uniref:Ancillary SecYEG translocon subunit n=1 Tax=Methylotuvimicrobium buryatense TaxID=95641 RepID=A0A4P9URM9_METBY|nr:tetratricopeptide repeat protein [Methylotuvimicrobium buryatense]QCW84152.1 tetratricopeptide repeat protein [Methylotuvimicrobium buryatense]